MINLIEEKTNREVEEKPKTELNLAEEGFKQEAKEEVLAMEVKQESGLEQEQVVEQVAGEVLGETVEVTTEQEYGMVGSYVEYFPEGEGEQATVQVRQTMAEE